MSSKRISSRDTTAKKAAELYEQHAEELEGRSGSLTTISGGPGVTVDPVGAVEVSGITVEGAKKRLRVNDDIIDMTFGKDKHYTFKRGVIYSVPTDLYNHLEECGLVYH
ncbi:hypothetical protein FDA94_29255 [Herbidospora galbida]|uniref:Uncharacterized protein n=1 Tax=Herbidospora galbida TaxID=2575442 RepID=A0A4U3M9G0_9ACTN|nr:hypothetical protein [Herbidospora galbida]TKK84704.1 hypothetical protein FDA94_29255 [Herbidospora galbida]